MLTSFTAGSESGFKQKPLMTRSSVRAVNAVCTKSPLEALLDAFFWKRYKSSWADIFAVNFHSDQLMMLAL